MVIHGEGCHFVVMLQRFEEEKTQEESGSVRRLLSRGSGCCVHRPLGVEVG